MIALIDYGAGNTASVSNVLRQLDADFILTNAINNITAADKIILPGVGEASFAMNRLNELNLADAVKKLTKPFLGICLGMQLLCERTEEGNTECLGVVPVKVKKFWEDHLKVPHMGWNSIKKISNDELFNNISVDEYFYFAHSYFVPLNEFTTSTCNYGLEFSASIRYKNFCGVQFHPEKSAQQGINILKNFLEI